MVERDCYPMIGRIPRLMRYTWHQTVREESLWPDTLDPPAVREGIDARKRLQQDTTAS